MSEPIERNGGYERSPDPTLMTSQLVMRELSSLRELLETRLDSMDKAQVLFNDGLTRIPTQTDRAVGNLKELHEKMFAEKFATIEEKFAGLQIRLEERDERVKQAALDTKINIDAALAAQEKSVSKQNEAYATATEKSEGSFTKQIDQLVDQFRTGIRALDDKIAAAIKTADDKTAAVEKQLSLLVGTGAGQASQQVTHQTSYRDTIALIALGVAVLALIAMVTMNVLKNN